MSRHASRRVGRAGIVRRLLRGTEGAITVETVLVLPVLVWTFAALTVFWDAYRAGTVALRATHTVSDLVSRETSCLDQGYLDGLGGVFDSLAAGGRPGGVGRDGPSAIRVSWVRERILSVTSKDGEPDEVRTETELQGSQVSGVLDPVVDLAEIAHLVPALAPGDEMIVVETSLPWAPIFDAGLLARNFESVATVRHRFNEIVCWED